jgi:hypothetical protein
VCAERQRRAAAAGAGSTASAAPAAKRQKVEPSAGVRPNAAMPYNPQQMFAAAMAASAGGRPPLPQGVAVQQMTAAQAAAAAAARLQSTMAQRKAQFNPIVRPASEDEKQFVPKPRLQVQAVGRSSSVRGLAWRPCCDCCAGNGMLPAWHWNFFAGGGVARSLHLCLPACLLACPTPSACPSPFS